MTTAETRLGPLTAHDVPAIARLHQTAFPGFFLSTLGEPFLTEFYKGFLHDPSAVTVVARNAGLPIGAAVGTVDPAGFFSRLVRRKWVGFASASARAIVTKPSVAPRLIRALVYRGDGPPDASGALLSSICVDPLMRGTGLGADLLAAWLSDALMKGAPRAFLTTDANENDEVNRFYVRQGWEEVGTFSTRQGRQMNRFMKGPGQ